VTYPRASSTASSNTSSKAFSKTCAPRLVLIAAACLAMLPLASTPSQAAAKIQHLISPGGIEAWFVQDATVPLIAMEYAFGGGATQDPADKPGVANMVAELIDEGAGELERLLQALQRLHRLSPQLKTGATAVDQSAYAERDAACAWQARSTRQAELLVCEPAGQLGYAHAAGQGRIGDQADPLLPAGLRQLVLEAAVVEAEVVLDGLVADRAQPLGRGDGAGQAPGRLVAAADHPHLAVVVFGADRARGRPGGIDDDDVVVRRRSQRRRLGGKGLIGPVVFAPCFVQDALLVSLKPNLIAAVLMVALGTPAAFALRQRFGAIRDMVLGSRVALSDGTVAFVGAKVVKSVAGYDTHKLFIGSFGTLGLLGEVTLKIAPLPAVDEALARLGLRRRVALTVPHVLVVSSVLPRGDLIATSIWTMAE